MRSRLALVVALALAPPPLRARAATRVKLDVCGARIEVTFEGTAPDVSRQALLDWIGAGARAVSGYFGRFPVARYRLRVITVDDRHGIQSGTTWGFGGAHTEVRIGQHVTRQELASDWVMTHEMIHVAFPNVGDKDPWIPEGVATYVEPLARAFAGTYPPRSVWSDLVEGLPKGLPGPGDPGLDRSRSWGRTYWGGALFFTRADVEIRRRTHGQRGLVDALRGILAAGGNDEARWTPARVFSTGDAAVGVPVLTELWAEMGPRPVVPDLDLLFARLGVPRSPSAPLDDTAPEAAVRLSISRPPERAACGDARPPQGP